ncbi:hypothetical protein GCM10009839_91420 [Catenulispora yoronensis]|uniref:PH domain-containing protein n=1 Tax=Catenulispora yoronensis TaxID=450799 RepID=A0ABN2VLI6_9ACTN
MNLSSMNLSSMNLSSMNLSILADQHSAPVTHLGQRILWTIVTLAAIAGIYLLMWRGWKKRQARQADVPPLNEVPEGVFPGEGGVEAVYVSSTSEGDWLDRIAVHGLGERSNAVVRVAQAGVLVEREGATDVFIPAAAIRGVRLATGMAGKYLRDEGLVVITWQHGDRTLDTGLKPRHGTDELVRALEAHFAVSATERPSE